MMLIVKSYTRYLLQHVIAVALALSVNGAANHCDFPANLDIVHYCESLFLMILAVIMLIILHQSHNANLPTFKLMSRIGSKSGYSFRLIYLIQRRSNLFGFDRAGVRERR